MSGFFDETYYLNHKVAQLAKTGVNDANGNPYTPSTLKAYFSELGLTPESHYNAYGRGENLNPNPYFNETEYLTAKLELLKKTDSAWADKSIDELRAVIEREGMTPAEHYERYGAFEADANGVLLNPSNAFDANAYFAAKLVEMKASGFVGAETMTVAQVMAIFKSEGLSPVTHYAAYGATEATASKNPLVQTVPSEQRVANDPARTENVPGNYNPPTIGAVSPDAVASLVTKPADVGAKVPGTVSPPVVPPSKPLPVPGDNGYIKPPAGLTDTNEKPVVPPSSATGGNWAQVNPDGSADLIKPDGNPGGSLPPGSIDPTDPSDPVPDTPAPPSGGGDGAIPFNLKLTQDSGENITITGTTGSEPVDPLKPKYVYFSGSSTVQVASVTVEGLTLKPGMTIDASAVTGNNPLGIYTDCFTTSLNISGSSTISNSISAKAASSITAGSKNDVVTISGTANNTGKIDLGAGADTLSVDSNYFANDVNLSGGSSIIKGLSDSGDSVIISGSFSGLPVASTGAVKSGGQWHYNATNDNLTYWNGKQAVTLTMPVDGYVGVTAYGLVWKEGTDPSEGLKATTSGTTLTLTGNPNLVSRVSVNDSSYALNNGYGADNPISYEVTTIDASRVGTSGGNSFILSTKGMTDAHTVLGSKQVNNNVTLGTGVTLYTGHSGGVGGDQVTLGSGNYASATLKFGGGSAQVVVSGTDVATVANITTESVSGKEFTLGLETGSDGASQIIAKNVTTGAGNDKVMLYDGAKIEKLDMGAGADELVFYTRASTKFVASTALTGVETIEIDASQGSNPSLDLSGVTSTDATLLTIIGDNANNKIICPQVVSTYVKTKENVSADDECDLVIGGDGVDSIDFGSTTKSAATSSSWAYTEVQSVKQTMSGQHPHIAVGDWDKYPVAKANNILFGSAGNDHIMCKGHKNDVFVYQVDTDAPASGAEYKRTAADFDTDTIYGFTLKEDFLTIIHGTGADKVAESIWNSGVSDMDSDGKGYINFGSGSDAGTSGSHDATYTLKKVDNKGNNAWSDYQLVITFDKDSSSSDTLTLNLVDVVTSSGVTLTGLGDFVANYA